MRLGRELERDVVGARTQSWMHLERGRACVMCELTYVLRYDG